MQCNVLHLYLPKALWATDVSFVVWSENKTCPLQPFALWLLLATTWNTWLDGASEHYESHYAPFLNKFLVRTLVYTYTEVFSLTSATASDARHQAGSSLLEVWWKVTSIVSKCRSNQLGKKLINVCAVSLPSPLYKWSWECSHLTLWNYHNQSLLVVVALSQIISHHRKVYISISIQSSMPSKLVLSPVASTLWHVPLVAPFL